MRLDALRIRARDTQNAIDHKADILRFVTNDDDVRAADCTINREYVIFEKAL